ncbi:MAG: LysR family transcriptional regulator [Porticoccus sp.]|nr:LysR family transcriptional regulator [Porticoccus sp.]
MNNWDDLRYFHAIAEAGSLNGACKHLGVNHSTVFRRINSLEEKLGVRLFERRDARYILTGSGEALLRRTAQITTAIDEVDRLIVGGDQALEGTIRITAPDGFAYYTLPPLIAEFSTLYPGINIQLLASSDDFNLSRLEADIALRSTSSPPEHLIGRKLFTMSWNLYGSSKVFTQPVGNFGLRQLAHYPLIGPDRALLRVQPMQWLEKHSDKLHFSARANTFMGMAALAREGVGLALLPEDVAEGLQQVGQIRGQLVAGKEQLFESDVWLLTHPDLRSNAKVRACMQFLTDRLTLKQVKR